MLWEVKQSVRFCGDPGSFFLCLLARDGFVRTNSSAIDVRLSVCLSFCLSVWDRRAL